MIPPPVVIVISADIEWRVLRRFFPDVELCASPYGEWFTHNLDVGDRREQVLWFHGGWGKIAAAASTQYIIDRWAPLLLVNLGTCGGFQGEIEKGTIILAERTIVYDIIEQMGDFDEHIAYYTTALDLSWLKDYPQTVTRTLLVSGDRDLIVEEIPQLKTRYGAVAGDWESGAIAWVAARNGTRCLILRGVTDLVGASGGEAYAHIEVFEQGTERVFERLLPHLSGWLERGLQDKRPG
ncbi:MAG: 5'-methylthioadenosine/S-adenosylhomocysteine nucleosidase [Anaerolineae bacterium]